MNTTFTTYAEKKAKQFLNLLQGYTKGIRFTAILILLLMGVSNAWANGGIGYKGVKFTKDGTATGWYNIHNVTWDYAHSSYECRSGQSKVTDFNNADLGIVTSLKLHSFVVIGWTNSGSDYVAGQLKYRLYKQSASAGNYSIYNVGNYGNNSWGAYDVLVTSDNNRVVGKNGNMDITLVNDNTAPGQYYLQLQGLGRMQWANNGNSGSFNDNNGPEVKASLVVPGFTTTSTSQTFDNTTVNSNSSETISFGTHFGTALKTNDCAISGTNATEFSVTSITESNVTVEFAPTSAGSKSAKLTITDAHGKTCAIDLRGTAEEMPATSHNITYTIQGTGWTYGTNPTSAEEGAQVTFVVTPTAGYRVSVTSTDVTLNTNGNNYTFTMPNKDVEITVDAKPEQYTVTLNKQSGEGGTSSVTATYAAAMPSITAPTRTGYTFNGYFDATSGGTKYYDANGNSAKNWDKTSATTLYAQWTANQYTVKFDANGGSGTISNQSFTYDIKKALTANTFTRKGYEFTGWNTQANGSGDSYSDKESVSNLSATDGATVTLYAQWNQLSPTTVYINPKTDWEKTLKIICDGEEADMTPVGCDGYYTAEVPGGTTELKFGGNNEQTLSLTVPTDGKVLYDMTSTIINHLYLSPGVWDVDGAWFAAYFFEGSNNTWKKMTAVKNVSGLFECEIPNGYSNVIFVRKNPSNQNLNFDDKWAQTGDLKVPTNGTNKFSISGWDNNGTWHKVWDNSCWTDYSGPSNTYTVTLDRQGATTGSENVTATFGDTPSSIVMPERTGYTFNGYYTAASEGTQIINAEGEWITNTTYIDKDGLWQSTECDITIYAQWIGNTYTVTLQHSTIEGYGSGGTSSVTATYDAAMPSATMPTAANGYVFMGYFDGEQGAGTQYYNADGTSAHAWNKAEDATLYAHFAKAEITQITLDKYTFEPVEAGGTGFVTATPTIEPTPTNAVVLCWRLLYNNGNEVPERSAQVVSGNIVKFSIAGLAAGTYKIEAVLRTGSNCGSGDVLSTKTVNFTIASNYTITVKYTCDGKEIMTASKVSAHVTEETEITAPDITGYTFSSWEAGDGVTIKSTNGNSVKITAIYDGYLTAKYTARPMVYFKNTLGWEKVYVYTFSDNAWWNDDTGVHPATNKLEQGEMTQIGESDIYYFVLNNTDGDYTQDNNANRNYIAFSNKDMSTYDAFYEAEAIYRGDHKNNLTLFIPQEDQTSSTTNQTKYYNKGIWMKYNSTESGYQMPTNNSVNDNPPGLGTDDGQGWSTYGNKFIAQTPGGYKFSITKHLEANKTYEFKIKNYVYVKDWENKDNNEWYGYNENSNTITDSKCTELHFHEESDKKHNCGNAKIKTTAEGEYTFTIDLSQGKVLLSVEYPVEIGDYRVIYKDNATWSHASAHDANWYHPSRVIKKNKTSEAKLDTISFFISREQGITYSMKFQQCTNIANNGTITWADGANIPALKDKGESGVYNFVVTQTANGGSISMGETVEPYSGNYYIRCEAMGGKWEDYKTNPDNRMFYSAFSESDANSFGEKFSHYATKYVEQNHNIKFTIANDYSPCISDTLTQDIAASGDKNPFGNLDENGTLGNDSKYNANIRFMWNRKTNKISRAYIGAASENNFLVLKGNEPLDDQDVNKISSKFTDTQNWIYELNIKVKPKTLVKLYACYPKTKAEKDAQYFRGTYNNNQFVEDVSAVQILGGDDSNFYDMRVLYDFKTNRLMAAWMPSGNIEGEVSIDADVMILREHQKDAACITLTNDDSKLKDVKTVYGVMRFNRWVLNNRDATKSGIEYCTEKINNQDTYSANVTNKHHPILSPQDQKTIYERALYFISFPFDVHLSDVFGFGTYGTHWVISTYNGQRRAKNGYFVDNCMNEDCTNWDYIWDPSNFVLKANTGYLLSLDLDLMKHDNMNFWLHNIENVELYFPSQSIISTIERTHYTMPSLSKEDYECTINFNKVGPEDPTYNPVNDHRVRDSYWRCIGVPSFANYDGSLYKTEQDAENEENPINWKTNYTWQADNAAFPFLYEWQVTDNSLQVQNTSNYNFKATFAYLVQNGNSIYWSAVNAKPSNIVARNQEVKRNYDWKITIARNGKVEDQTFVRLSDNEQVTTEFDFNQDLSKEFNYGRSDIYTLIGYEKAAANSLPLSEQTTLIPLGLSIEYNGDYTIAMPDGTANIGVTLIDTESNTRTNLSAGMEYTLTLKKGDYNNRFFIEISPVQQVPTDIEYVTGDSNSQDNVRKVLIDNILYIVRDGQIFDARGVRVK